MRFDVDAWRAALDTPAGVTPLATAQAADPHLVLVAHLWLQADVRLRVCCRRCGATLAVVVDPRTAPPQRLAVDGYGEVVVDPRRSAARHLLVAAVRRLAGRDYRGVVAAGDRAPLRRTIELRSALLDRPGAPRTVTLACPRCGLRPAARTHHLIRQAGRVRV